jgi:hypothetical protein
MRLLYIAWGLRRRLVSEHELLVLLPDAGKVESRLAVLCPGWREQMLLSEQSQR